MTWAMFFISALEVGVRFQFIDFLYLKMSNMQNVFKLMQSYLV